MNDRPTAPADRVDDDIDLSSLLLTLWLGKWWIFTALAVALIGGSVAVLNTPASYRADALVQIEERGTGLALPEALRNLTATDTRTVTEIEIIRSRLVLGQAVAAANFNWHYAADNPPVVGQLLLNLARHIPSLAGYLHYAPGAERLELEFLQVPPSWVGQGIILTSEGDERFTVVTPAGSTHEGRVGQLLRAPDTSFGLKLAVLNALPGRRFVLSQRDELTSINTMRDSLVLAEEGRQSGILRLQYTARSRAEAERVLDAITQSYVAQNIGRSAAEANSGVAFIRSLLPETQARLQAAEEALNRYRRQQQSIDLSLETQALLTQMGAVEAEIALLQAREDEIKLRYTRSHPVYQQVLAQRGRLEENLRRLQAEAAALPGTQREMMNLTREVEIAQATYTQLLTRAQELSVMGASSVGSVRLIDAARASAAPVAPRSVRIMAFAGMFGLLAGAGFVFLRYWLRKGIISTAQLEEIGLPVFGVVGISAKAQRTAERREYCILAQTDPMDLSVEALRSLRTSLHFAVSAGSNRSVAVTSGHPAAGKSFICLNLAYVAAEAGMRVCLVDADLRRGALRRYFALPTQHPGLSDYLAGAAPPEKILHSTGIPNLDFVAAGRHPPNPSELLMRPTWTALLQRLGQDFDLVVVDAPPALMVTDAALIAAATGAVLLVARQSVTHCDEIVGAKRNLEQAGVHVSGSILNFFNPRSSGSKNYYKYRYYNYRYKPEGK